MAIFGFLAASPPIRDRVNELLAYPRLTRSQMLSLTTPRPDSGVVNNWLRYNYLDLGFQVVVGDARQFGDVAGRLQANEKLNQHRRYSGGDALKCVVLTLIGQIGLPFRLSAEIIELVLKRAQRVIVKPPSDEALIVVTTSLAGEYEIAEVPASEIDSEREWLIVIRLDHIVARFLRWALK